MTPADRSFLLRGEEMHRTYVIAEVIVRDQEKYDREFVPVARQAHQRFGVHMLVRTDVAETLRSETPYSRIVLMEFPNRDAVYEWHKSPEMHHAFEIAKKCANDIMIRILDGVEEKT